ncbi:glycerophosphoryl diester phosphodiesterase [Oikeobacillus pervagus]|uniref:Glycerophosphoryl diester phosphodiesterase n=1 Tax=Oikeobacillus pervagus TaxID=1325931 RepID=A0AAJ1WHY5_9BACI|nr:glycerophosphodiester phosphodiesterase [Oikeobacillus pervagus]MDQ0213813.1 glycerophosphoryl diester phosphodiesterase [Oikeobacillus pervagus]
MTLIFAHRGFSSLQPENTMQAFQAAYKAGADGIEIDVQLTKDGEIVVIHDEKVDRTTNGKGYVKDYLLTDLKKLDASYKFKKKIKKYRIPTLAEVFQWMTENEMICNIELKNNKIQYEFLEEKVIQLIREFHFEHRVILSSFNHYSIVHCYQIAPDIEIAPLYSNGIFMPWLYAKSINAKAIHPNVKTLNADIIQSSLNDQIQVRPYTINDPKVMEWLYSLQCSAIITDDPEKAITVKKLQRKK